MENSGNNPFTGGVTSGLWLDASAGQLFVSAGSELYETPAPRALLVVETPGTGAMRIVIGGQEVTPAGGGEPYLGARIAQNGINFDGISTIIDPLMNFLPGDFNGNGSVENADLTLLLNNWGAGAAPVPPGWTGDPPTGTAIDNSELTALLNNWGAIGTPSGGARLAVPEGTSLAIVALAVAFVVAAVRHRYFRARGGAG